MNKLIKAMNNGAVNFVRDEEGAQIVEYALIIALVSIVLALALATIGGGGAAGPFGVFITRVTNCLTGGGCTAP